MKFSHVWSADWSELGGLSPGLWRGENIQEESRPDQHQLCQQQLQAAGSLHPPEGFSLCQVRVHATK